MRDKEGKEVARTFLAYPRQAGGALFATSITTLVNMEAATTTFRVSTEPAKVHSTQRGLSTVYDTAGHSTMTGMHARSEWR